MDASPAGFDPLQASAPLADVDRAAFASQRVLAIAVRVSRAGFGSQKAVGDLQGMEGDLASVGLQQTAKPSLDEDRAGFGS